MTGLKGFNLDSFNLAELALRAQGWEVRNPACLGAGWANYEHYMEVDFIMLAQCDAITFLPGSPDSPGATREAAFAAARGIEPRVDLLAGTWDLLARMYGANS